MKCEFRTAWYGAGQLAIRHRGIVHDVGAELRRNDHLSVGSACFVRKIAQNC